MTQWSDNRGGGPFRPNDDRTVIRPMRPFQGTSQPIPDPPPTSPPPPPQPPARVTPPPRKRSPVLAYVGLAMAFLIVGGAGGILAVLYTKGAISFSAPKEGEGPVVVAEGPTTTPDGPLERSQKLPDPAPRIVEPEVAENPEDLDIPADPFFDMATSAVIPLAGDPVLLSSTEGAGRIELSERPLGPGLTAEADKGNFAAASVFVLDSIMLDDKGELVTQAPGSEADFRFGNFGGGSDEASLDISQEETGSGDGGKELPVFLKPQTNTLNLYLTERPIGQGPNRIEVTRQVTEKTTVEALLTDSGFDKETTAELVKFVIAEFGHNDLLPGDKIAARGIRMPNRVGRIGDYYRPVQVSLYGAQGYIGTAALSTAVGEQAYVAGADPWFGKEIAVARAEPAAPTGGLPEHRLIDGLYATAVRNAVPASIVGEAISYLASTTDLKRTVKPDERFTLVFSDAPRDDKRGGGKVLFAGVRRGDDWTVRCYVMKAPGNRGFACVSEAGKVTVSGAMLVPVKGVLTSKFGMRFHPIKKIERLHAGVDWAAPTGTPIRAAFSGKVTYRDVRGGYGNFIELTHKEGITSRYAHMHEYGDGIQLGSVVQAGDLIGYVGTTGLSTGPHLHFEIRHKGEPTDPLAFEMETGTDAPQSVSNSDIEAYRTSIAEVLATQ